MAINSFTAQKVELYNVTLDGNVIGNPGSITRGGVQVQPNATFDMRAAAIIRNCYSSSGGGVYVTGGNINMENGSIISNKAGAGGGVYITAGGMFNMIGGTISGNMSTYGGGVYLNLGSVGIMTGGVVGGVAISDANMANAYAGGVAVYHGSRFLLDGGSIEGNQVVSNSGGNGGGGVYVIDSSTFELRSGAIRNNFVSAGANYPSYGGGIMLGELTYVVPPGLAPTSTLFMSGGAIEGNESGYRGGGVAVVANCNFFMTGGTIGSNSANTNINGGGGVYIGAVLASTGVTFMMDGGEITENIGFMGGGVLILGSQSNPNYIARFTMNSGEITNNESSIIYGGGVCVLNRYSEFIMGDPTVGLTTPIISGNRSNIDGGGVYNSGTCIINGANISSNIANQNGGGVYVTVAGMLNALDVNFITGNSAPYGNGGGINTEDLTYRNLNTDSDTVFLGNSASVAYLPPANALILYPNIGFTSTSITTHPLNNYDINYTNGEPLTFQVTYHGNGGTGSHIDTNIVPGTEYIILSPGEMGIDREGYTFIGWNTQPNGSGATYRPGEIINIVNNLILYAQWFANPVDLFTVTYSANGGTGGRTDIDIPSGTAYTILSPQEAEINRMGYAFTGWNTQPDGSGTAYSPGNVITLSGNLILYAQWIVKIIPSCCIPCISYCYMSIKLSQKTIASRTYVCYD